MDNELNKKIQNWLNAKPDKQDVATGALLLLQVNRNRNLYMNILRKPQQMKEKLIYELRKHIKYQQNSRTDKVYPKNKYSTKFKNCLQWIINSLKKFKIG